MAVKAADSRRFRYERKFLVDELDPREVESVVRLHPALFREVYPPRWVDNIYLDSFDARNYRDNVDGLRDRVKVRIRWYGDLFGRIDRPVLELKRKRGLLGTKNAYPMSSFSLGPGFDLRVLAVAVGGSDLPEWVREEVMSLSPALLNRYRRRYLLSADGGIRLTLDAEREFYSIGPRNNTFCFKLRDSRTSIVELKHSPEWAERAIEVAARLPFRMTKSSKYVQGVDQLEVR
jgi:hypothetical protein